MSDITWRSAELVAGLLAALEHNLRTGAKACGFFSDRPGVPPPEGREIERAALLLCGRAQRQCMAQRPGATLDLLISRALEALEIGELRLAPSIT